MKKIFTTIGCALAMAAFALPLSAQVTLTGKLNNTAAPGTVISSDSYGWWIAQFYYQLNNPTSATVTTTGATATFQYLVGDQATEYSTKGTMTVFSNTELTVNTGSDQNFAEFLEQGSQAGAGKWQIVISGLTADGQPVQADCSGVTMNNNDLVITYYYTTEAMDEDGNGDSGDTISWQEVSWNSEFTASSTSQYWQLPSFTSANYNGDDNGFRLESNSSTNLVYEVELSVYSSDDMDPSNALTVEAVEVDGNYVYNVTLNNNYYTPIYVWYHGLQEVEFTAVPGFVADANRETITAGSPFTAQPNVKYYYDAPADPTPAYIVSNSSTNYKGLYLTFATTGGYAPELIAVQDDDDNYIYVIEDEIGGQTYYLEYTGEDTVEFTLELGEYKGGTSTTPSTPSNDIELDEPFTVSGSAATWGYVAEDDLGPVTLVSNSNVNLITAGLLAISVPGVDLTDNWTPVLLSTGWAYNGEINAGNSYIFSYFGEDEVEFTLSQGKSQASYMTEQGQVYYEADPYSPAVFVYWDESLTEIPTANLVAVVTTPTGYQVEVDGFLTTYAPGEEDIPSVGNTRAASNNALIFLLGEVIAQYGAGEYTIEVASGVVMNDNGEWNNGVKESFTVEALPAESAVEAQIVISGDEITVTWGDNVISQYDPYETEVLIMTPYGTDPDDEKEYRLGFGSGVTIADNALVISIASLDLVEGQTYLLNIPDMFVYVGENNEYNAGVYDYEFTAQASGVSSLLNANGEDVIYNLQGVRVSNPAQGGIYIINGKKVLVK